MEIFYLKRGVHLSLRKSMQYIVLNFSIDIDATITVFPERLPADFNN